VTQPARRASDAHSPGLAGPGRHWLALLLLGWMAPVMALGLKVEVSGLEGKERDNVLALLDIYQERDAAGLDLPRVRALHRLAPQQIRDALAPFGLYRVAIDAALEQSAPPDGPWLARYRVSPGEPVRIGAVDYQVRGPGEDDPAFPERFPMQRGDVLLHADYERAKSELRYAASANGYLDYRLPRHQVLVDPEADSAAVHFHLDTGPQYHLGEVTFNQDLLDDGLLQRYLRFAPGAVYDPDLLLELQSRLLGSEYYSEVEIVPHKEARDDEGRIPIEVIATRNKANKYRLGVGFATDSGPRFSMDWRRRYLNRWGHKFRTELILSPRHSEWNLDYRIPVQDPTRDYLTIRPQSVYDDTASRKGWVHTVQFAHSRLTGEGWRRTGGFDFRYEDVAINDAPAQRTSELVPNISWSKTVSDDPVNTNRGYRIKYTLLGTFGGVLAEHSYLSGQIQFKWVRRFAERYRLIARTDLGATLADSVDDLPASRRFYAGGDASIRGWDYDALGPTDPLTGQTVGGRYLAVGSLELEREIRGPWSAALFTDFGNAFDPDYDQQLAYSAGVGVRWASPIGQVRLDLAFALSKDNDNGGWPPARLHIVIGPDL